MVRQAYTKIVNIHPLSKEHIMAYKLLVSSQLWLFIFNKSIQEIHNKTTSHRLHLYILEIRKLGNQCFNSLFIHGSFNQGLKMLFNSILRAICLEISPLRLRISLSNGEDFKSLHNQRRGLLEHSIFIQ